ncbi:MAG: ribonuclease HII [Selenomonas sp.]|nr:ribonuclease HII [Selenomonas sp.]MBQ1615536.1 ribonuclease HII [Selenomonas sp.]MBQ1920782.1 ribonuclease HII [Selenomonas sp.]MBQ4212693.1 ribonuclease HII [Selenomonas sp.]
MSNYTIKQVEALFAEQKITEEFLTLCRNDGRKAIGTLVRRYERQQQERQRVAELYNYERQFWAKGCEFVAGVDEAGRGPLAGPVSVAAVILPHDLYLPKINDSKKLSAKVRDELYDEIMDKALAIKTALVDAKTIDRVNIYQATINGMYESIFGLAQEPQAVLIDAVKLDNLPMVSESIIKGDAKSASIAAASIIAKVNRDRLMDEYDKQYPEYGFAQHKGYGTAQHIEALKKYGPCPIHRLSFEPIRSMVDRQTGVPF